MNLNSETKQSALRVKMGLPYEFKKAYAEKVIHEFIQQCTTLNKDTFVAVGGLDSITLYTFIKSLGYNIKGVSVSAIENKTVRAVHKQIGIITVNPIYSKYHIIKNYGLPVFSKDIAGKIYTLQHPTEKNKGYRNAILTGVTTEKAKVKKSQMTKLSQKYIDMFNNGCFDCCKISDKCCIYMKEKPIAQYAKNNNAFPFLGLMASESHRRFMSLARNGCNYYANEKTRSAPFSIFTKSDVLQLAVEINAPIPAAYGEIIEENGVYKTTGSSRTGCDICAFGIQYEKTRPHRFDKLFIESPKEWDFWINKMGYGELFDKIGFEYKQPYNDNKAWKE